MHKKALWTLCLLTSLCSLGAEEQAPPPATTGTGIIVEFRPSYFYPISSDFRDVFHEGGIDYQLTGTFPVYYGQNAWLRGIDVWWGLDYFSKEGHSTALHDKTEIQIAPITLGLKYFFPPLGKRVPVTFYTAAAMKYYFVYTYNHSDYVKREINQNGMGGVVETGFTVTACKHWIFDLFAAYSFKSFGAPSVSSPSVETTGMNVSSINVGTGIGYKF